MSKLSRRFKKGLLRNTRLELPAARANINLCLGLRRRLSLATANSCQHSMKKLRKKAFHISVYILSEISSQGSRHAFWKKERINGYCLTKLCWQQSQEHKKYHMLYLHSSKSMRFPSCVWKFRNWMLQFQFLFFFSFISRFAIDYDMERNPYISLPLPLETYYWFLS